MKTRIITFSTIFLSFMAWGQSSKPFYAPPMLEFVLSKEWNTQELDYNEAMWNSTKRKYVNSKENISIHYVTDVIQNLNADYDSILIQIENSLKYQGIKYEKTSINGFVLYSIQNKDSNENSSGYSAYALHDEGYYAELRIIFGKLNSKKSYPIVKTILKNINIVSPKYIDKKLGYPIHLSVDRDSLFKARIDTIRVLFHKKYRQYYSVEQIENKINRYTPMDIISDALNDFSLEKKYSIKRDVMTGKLNFEETLDWEYLDKKSPKLQFFYDYIGDYHGETSKGRVIAIMQNLATLIDIEGYKAPSLGIQEEGYNNGDTIFWNTMEHISRDSFILMSAQKKNDKWNLTFKTFHYKHHNLSHTELDNGYYNNTNKKKKRFLVIRSSSERFSPEYWLGLSVNQNSTFYHIQDTFRDNYWVTYCVYDPVPLQRNIDTLSENRVVDDDEVSNPELLFLPKEKLYSMRLSVSDFINYDQKYNKSFDKYTYDTIANNLELKNLCDSTWFLDYSLTSNSAWQKEQARFSIVENFIKRQFMDHCPPEKRVYISQFKYADLNQDGVEDIYRYAISNGEIVDIKIYEESNSDILPLYPDKKVLDSIMDTVDFRYLQKISLHNENVLARTY